MPSQRIRLKFLSPVHLHKNKDFLSIFNGKRIVKNMTGYVAFPKQYESVGNYMYLELNSNVFGQREGFFALVSVITKNKG